MAPRRPSAPTELTALMIAPDRALAEEFAGTLGATRAFQILAELKEYPPQPVLEMRLRQLQPHVVLLDLASDLDKACELIRFVAAGSPATHVVGLHTRNDSDAIVRSLRVGASEFLSAPFDPAVQEQAVSRLRRLLEPQMEGPRNRGKVVFFSSTKPGSGASTLAAQTAFALRRLTGKKLLLADLDLMGGTISFYLKLSPSSSLLEALERDGEAANWPALAVPAHGLHVLNAPAAPRRDSVEPGRLHEFLERARQLYEWVILDLPAVFHRLSLLALSESDVAFLVSTADLPALHLTRKAVNLLSALGVGQERFHVLVNRVSRRDGLRTADVAKIFNCPVYSSFPNDYGLLDRAVALGEPLGSGCELGRTIEDFAGRLAGVAAEKLRSAALAACLASDGRAQPLFQSSM